MFRFVFKETSGTNELFEFREIGCCQLCRPLISAKKWRSDLIDPLVGTLGGEDRGHEQLPRGTMAEFHFRAWHRALECLCNRPKAFLTIQRW